ncbi:RimJ/RimL family protein N-acetyltransferase [Haloactinopolyspora alba]|uniref:RimJ/RimL family protein N-acetyltransferase n=1 Tax=Haloactinopolyspora alba TaxID=648780 RepID=A0A2P8EFV1_9ACTN|nr:GNAT family protein [Haloactinopolyspora alba]PSL08339.1 RimJ/RimL family protein N-acetyltransferase [Haloactinopolyspora alba]
MIDAAAVTTKPTLAGDRVRLVPIDAHHAPAVFASLQDPETMRLTGTHTTFTFEQVERFCATRPEQDDRLDLAIEAAGTGEYAGGIVLMGIDGDNETAGFRIDLVQAFQGRGFGPEATRLLLRYAFDRIGLHRVRLEVFDFNQRAVRAYEKCGFVLEGRERDALQWDGERHDTLIMGILRPEFAERDG